MLAVFWVGLLGTVAFVVIARRHRVPVALTPIAQAPDATLVHVRGKVIGDMPLRAPFSGRACVYYWIHVRAAGFNQRKNWRAQKGDGFAIADDTGTATVPVGRFVVPHEVMHIERASRLAPRIKTTLATLGIELPEIAEVTIYEGSLGEGDIVEVTGAGMRRVSAPEGDVGERGFRDRPVGIFELAGDVEVIAEKRPVRTLD